MVSYDENTGEALLTQRNKMSVGEKIEILTPGRVGREAAVAELYDDKHEPIQSTPHPYMSFYMKVPFEVREGDIVRAGY